MVYKCISFVEYSILLNGYPGDFYSLKRGLRQKDPLSPYLFVICAEDLSTLIQREEDEGRISRVSV